MISNIANSTVFSNTGVITIVDGAPASPYGSTINVSGMAGTLSTITVTLSNVSHDYVQDMSVILQAPSGQSLLLQSGVADGASISNLTYTFSDLGASQLSATLPFTSGTYKPTGHFWDIWPAPAPPTPPGTGTYNIPGPFTSAYPLSTLTSTFGGLNPNGAWKLWVADFSNGGDPGIISGGWSLDITTSIVTPVILQNFKAIDLGCKTGLSWITLDEVNSKSFDIERKAGNSEFQKITSLNASGRSAGIQQYNFIDQEVSEGQYDYRLKMIDVDGRFEYSDIVSVNSKCNSTEIILYPNPSNQSTFLKIKAQTKENYQIKIINIFGSILYRTSVDINHETKVITLPTQSFSKGIYSVVIEAETEKENLVLTVN